MKEIRLLYSIQNIVILEQVLIVLLNMSRNAKRFQRKGGKDTPEMDVFLPCIGSHSAILVIPQHSYIIDLCLVDLAHAIKKYS